MIYFNVFADKVVKFYRYRTARLSNWSLEIELTDHDIKEIRKILTASGYKMDNHIVFSIENCNFWLSDRCLYIGGEIVEGGY